MSTEYNVIAFSRPGESGLIPLIGALWAGENKNITNKINAWISPSTSSFISVLTICGYKCIEIIEFLILNPEISTISSPFKNPLNVGKDIEKLKCLFEKIILKKFDNIPTLKYLFDTYNTTLVGVGYTLEKQEVEYLHAFTYPNMNILDFLCISYSMVGNYKPYKLGNNFWIDGSIIDPFPISSIEIGDGKILGISTNKNKIPITAKDPIGKVKDLTKAIFESIKMNGIYKKENMTMVTIDQEESKKDENILQLPNFECNKVSKALKCGWTSFILVHPNNEKVLEETNIGAELQE